MSFYNHLHAISREQPGGGFVTNWHRPLLPVHRCPQVVVNCVAVGSMGM